MNKEEKKAIIDVLGSDDEHRFYVYALFDPRPDFNRVFYIGKGESDRVWQHEKGMETELVEINKKNVSPKEKELLISELSEKYKTIKKIHDKGLEVQKIIIKWGLTEQEAFYAESALINIFNYPERKLTNKVNGHASEKEKNLGGKITEAMTVETFYRNNTNPKKIETLLMELKNNGKVALFVNIATSYRSGMTASEIADCARSSWNLNRSIDYVFAMKDSVVRGIYKVKEAYKGFKMGDGVLNRSRLADICKRNIFYNVVPVNISTSKRKQILQQEYAKFTDEQKKDFRELIGEFEVFKKEVSLTTYVFENENEIRDEFLQTLRENYCNWRLYRNNSGSIFGPQEFLFYSDSKQ